MIAHEIGHHVQNLARHPAEGRRGAAERRRGPGEPAFGAARTPGRLLCRHLGERGRAEGILEVGDIDEGLNAASQIGDDTLQRQTQGRVVPDSFTHGSAEQRSRWFKRGYQTGAQNVQDAITTCNTFGNGPL